MENLGLFGGFEYLSTSRQKYKNVPIQEFNLKLDSQLRNTDFETSLLYSCALELTKTNKVRARIKLLFFIKIFLFKNTKNNRPNE